MKTFPFTAAGCVAGLLLLFALAWLWLRRRRRGLGRAPGQRAAGLGGVPPFRITLVPVPDGDEPFEDAKAVDASTRSLEGAGYRRLDDFEIQEMEGAFVRGLWHPQQLSYAAIVEHPHAGVVTEVVALYTDRSLLTVTSAPESGLDRPERARRVSLRLPDAGEAHRLHERLVAETDASEHRPIGTTPEQFALAFEGAYRIEQDWRIARGGIRAEELRRAAAAAGQEPPDEAAVERVRVAWRRAIADFVGDEALRAWLASEPMPASAREARRERTRVVHDRCDADELVDELAGVLAADDGDALDPADEEAWERAHAQARARLAPAFAAGVRAGFAEAQALLPEKRRFRRLGSVEAPWPADFYLEPEEATSGD